MSLVLWLGDVAINRGAPITIMTTEVFRNMIYDPHSDSQLSNLFMVVFDEFHYMNDPERGTVWEESVISCPPSVRILALSATMGNVEDIKGWIESIHGPTSLVQSKHRPVPLRYFYAMKQGIFPLFRNPNAGPGTIDGVEREGNSSGWSGTGNGDPDTQVPDTSESIYKASKAKLVPGCSINPTILRLEEQASKQMSAAGSRGGTGRPFRVPRFNPNLVIAQYSDLARELHSLHKVPAIVFVFSRAGCEKAANLVVQSSKSSTGPGTGRKKKQQLLTPEELQAVNTALVGFVRAHPEIPVSKQNVQILRAGVGVHHAGLITVWKAFIEDLFNANLIKILFATETLAAGEGFYRDICTILIFPWKNKQIP